MSRVGVPVCRRRTVPNKQKLTSLTVTKLQPAARPYLVWDTHQRGLALQIQPSGYRSFKLIYRFHNRPRWYHIGAADAIALADARKLAAELMLEVIRGKDPAGERRNRFEQSVPRRRAQSNQKPGSGAICLGNSNGVVCLR